MRPGRSRDEAQPSHRRPTGSVVAGIAARLGRTPAQILLRWCVQRFVPVITKSTHRDRIAENAQVFDFEVSAHDIEQLDALDRSGGPEQHSSANGVEPSADVDRAAMAT